MKIIRGARSFDFVQDGLFKKPVLSPQQKEERAAAMRAIQKQEKQEVPTFNASAPVSKDKKAERVARRAIRKEQKLRSVMVGEPLSEEKRAERIARRAIRREKRKESALIKEKEACFARRKAAQVFRASREKRKEPLSAETLAYSARMKAAVEKSNRKRQDKIAELEKLEKLIQHKIVGFRDFF